MDVIVAPLVAGLFATFVGIYDVKLPLDACKPPAIRTESANLAALPGPDSPACLAARKAEAEKKKEEKPEEKKP
jgi:hypothetical protein